ncbi:MAG: hypothetical protein Kow0010_19510 [Dehalococcoidia bacterium]
MLDLLANGYTNGEIAGRLGITLDGAKFHVREIMSKLGVDSREDAAAYWRERNSLRGRLSRAQRAIVAAVSLRAALVAIAGLVVAIGGAAAALMLLAGGDDPEPAAATPTDVPASPTGATASLSSTATPSPTPGPSAIGGAPLRVLELQEGAAFPAGYTFYVEGGCTNCDGPATSLDRVYSDYTGAVHAETVFEVPQDDLPEGAYITDIAVLGNGYGILVGVCEPSAYCGGVAAPFPGARVTFHYSGDGGVTWSRVGALDGFARPIVAWSGGAQGGWAARHIPIESEGPWPSEYVALPSGEVMALGAGLDPTAPAIVLDGEAFYLLGEDGGSLWTPSGGSGPHFSWKLPEGGKIVGVAASEQFTVLWRQEDGFTVPPGTYFGRFEGRSDGMLEAAFAFPPGVEAFLGWPGTVMDDGSPVITVAIEGRGFMPAIVDLEAGTLTPIAEYFADRARTGDRSRLHAVVPGPVVRIVSGDDCLNLRQSPSFSGAVLGCYADGVLLVDRQETRVAEGVTWVGVTAPEGYQGWAAAEFVDITGRDMSVAPAVHPEGTRTGNPDIDPVIAAIESGDPAEIVSVTRFTTVECVAESQGIGSPPICPSGTPEGTPIEVLPGASCEGYYIPREAFVANPRLPVGPDDRLFAVVRLPGAFALIYADEGPELTSGRVVYVDGGQIVSTWDGCATTPVYLFEERFGDAEVFLAPP